TAAGADGRFRLTGLAPGSYVVRASMAGRQPASSAAVTVAGGAMADAGDLRLTRVVELEAVQVRAQRPPVVHAEDRNVYSVKDMPTAIGGAADVMRTLPELEVDLNGGIKMVGNRPVIIHINSRPSPLKGEALTEFIRNLPADRIDRIEVIPNPSVRFEGGEGAIVNIILRRGVELGLSGSVSLNGATRGGNGVSGQIAYQRGKLTLFGGGSSRFWNFDDRAIELRQNLQASPITFLDQDRRSEGKNFHGSTDLTAELTVGPKETLWASASAYMGGWGNEGLSHNRLLDSLRAPTRIYERVTDTETDFLSSDLSLGFRRIVEAQRNELSVEVRRNGSGNEGWGRYEETTSMRVFDDGSPLSSLRLAGSEEDEATFSAKIDYMRPVLGKGGRLEIGARTSREDQSNLQTLRLFAPVDAGDPRESSGEEFDYLETQHSAYANLSRKAGRLSLQGGLRAEMTRLELDPRGEGAQPGFDRDFFTVFPTANLNFDFKEGRSLRLNYSRRERRPFIWDLNPFIPRVDPLNVRLGNPELEPAATHSLGMDLSWRASAVTLRLAPYYRRTVNEVEYIRTVDPAGVSTTIPRNLATVQNFGSTLNASLRPSPWGNASASVGLSRDERDGGQLGPQYSRSGNSYFFTANTTLQPGKGVGIQASVRMNSPRESAQGRYSSTPWTELGVRKEMFNRKGSLNVRFADPLDIYRTKFVSRDPTFASSSRNRSSFGGRSLSASFTLRFGKPPQRKSSEQGGPPAGGGGGGAPP
ncbi:MAG: TonB-dependent receptor, partial [Gemmatimonadetes bacterium]|nr:TonB-dependent receptor [Gemmatimonadota bacterium]